MFNSRELTVYAWKTTAALLVLPCIALVRASDGLGTIVGGELGGAILCRPSPIYIKSLSAERERGWENG